MTKMIDEYYDYEDSEFELFQCASCFGWFSADELSDCPSCGWPVCEQCAEGIDDVMFGCCKNCMGDE